MKRQGLPANEEQKRINGRESQASSSCSTGQNPQYGAAGVSEQAVEHQGGWGAQEQHSSPAEMNTSIPTPQHRGSQGLSPRSLLGFPMAARAVPSCNECPAMWAGGAQNPWGDTFRAGEERPRRLSQLPALFRYPGKCRRGHSQDLLQLDIESTRDFHSTKGRTVLLIIFPGDEFCVILQFSRNCCHIREDAK